MLLEATPSFIQDQKLSIEIMACRKTINSFLEINDLDNDPINYLRPFSSKLKKSAIIAAGSSRMEVARLSGHLALEGLSQLLILSGANTKATLDWDESEATRFKREVVIMGVKEENIRLDPYATNTGENIINGYELAISNLGECDLLMFCCLPFVKRRALGTADLQLKSRAENKGNKMPVFIPVSPKIAYGAIPLEKLIDMELKELDKLKKYQGIYITPQEFSLRVLTAERRIITLLGISN